MKRIEKLAPVLSVMFRSPDSKTTFAYSPGLCALPNGRLVGTMDAVGEGLSNEKGIFTFENNRPRIGKIFISDDNGVSWQWKENFPFIHARPFMAGGVLYVLGHRGDLMIMKSTDFGETWSLPVALTHGESWHQAPCNVTYANGNVYLVMEKKCYNDCKSWDVSVLAPILMRGSESKDLTDVNNWTFASQIAFRDLIERERIHYFGVPFYPCLDKEPVTICKSPAIRKVPPIGWLETNVVQFRNPEHIWHDPTGHTFYLWMRTHTAGVGYAAILKVRELENGSMVTETVKVPSGKETVFVPCPGGQMKFHILYDEQTELYWLLSSQTTDSMIRPEAMPPSRYDLPNNERQRLVLHFSKNCIDWCFAGLVDAVDQPMMSRSYASMAINGDDLIILSRSGDETASTAHNGNLITCHRVEKFRELVY